LGKPSGGASQLEKKHSSPATTIAMDAGSGGAQARRQARGATICSSVLHDEVGAGTRDFTPLVLGTSVALHVAFMRSTQRRWGPAEQTSSPPVFLNCERNEIAVKGWPKLLARKNSAGNWPIRYSAQRKLMPLATSKNQRKDNVVEGQRREQGPQSAPLLEEQGVEKARIRTNSQRVLPRYAGQCRGPANVIAGEPTDWLP